MSVAPAPAVVWSTQGQRRGAPFGVWSSPVGHKCEHQRFPPRVRPDLHPQRDTSEIRHAEPITVHIFGTPQESHGVLARTYQSHSSDIIGVLSGRQKRAQAQLHDSCYAKSLAALNSLMLVQSLRPVGRVARYPPSSPMPSVVPQLAPTPVWRRANVRVVPFAGCAEEDLSTSLSVDRMFGVSETTFALVTVLSDLFGDGYARPSILLLEQAETLSVYKVRLWLAFTLTIMLKYQAVCWWRKQAERDPMLQVR